jgi:hypothetical protein
VSLWFIPSYRTIEEQGAAGICLEKRQGRLTCEKVEARRLVPPLCYQ